MSKILISAGCSFSECNSDWIDTWPRHLAKRLDCVHYSLGQGSMGNGYISRALVHTVCKLLKEYDPEDIIVAVQWSSWDRIDLRLEQIPIDVNEARDAYNGLKGPDWPDYPVNWNKLPDIVQDEITNNFPMLKLLIQDPAWNIRKGFIDKRYWTNISMLLHHDDFKLAYFKLFANNVSKQIYTLEHMLRVQWLLDTKNIKYFMMKMNNAVLDFDKNSEVEYLVEELDFNNFIKGNGIIEWTMENFGQHGFPNYPDLHPGTEQHKQYTQKVILPYMEDKCLL